jgi:aminoglycoside phosphotransferase (APT) family kinase protein
VNEVWLLDEPGGERAVLKIDAGTVDHLHATARVVEDLRARGYPTPRWLFTGRIADGTTYHVQEFVPGELAGRPTVMLARQLIELIEVNAGVDVWPERDLSACVVSELASCVADLRSASPEVSDVACRYEQLVARLGRIDLPGGEFVHGDLHWGNVLVHRGQVSGVIDIESGGSGTRAIDYGRLLRDTYFPHRLPEPGVREMIRRAGDAVAGPEVLALCTSAATLDNLCWRVRCRPDRIPAMVPAFLRLADDLEQALGSH